MSKKSQEKHHENVKRSKREIPRKCPKGVKRSTAKISKKNQEKYRKNVQEKSREAPRKCSRKSREGRNSCKILKRVKFK